MTPQPAEAQAIREIYALLRLAAARRQAVTATYDGLPRLLCPHVLGRKSDRLHMFCYHQRSSQISQKSRRSASMKGAMAQSSISKTSMRARRANKLLPSARASVRLRNSAAPCSPPIRSTGNAPGNS